MPTIAQTTLSDGSLAVLETDPHVPGAVQLLLDGTPQSHVHPGAPDSLFFEYVARIGNVIDGIVPPRQPISALHLGAGALTLPRYIAATRPGSKQQVVELNGDLVDFVRTHLPLPARAQIRIRRGDARTVTEKLPAGMVGAMDLCVVDVFTGARTPAHLTTIEFYTTLNRYLAPHGVLAANVADGSGTAFLRSQLATLQKVFRSVAAVAEPQVLKGRRFGNTVALATNSEESWDWLVRAAHAGPHPAKLLSGTELTEFIGSTAPVTDSTAVPSPQPPTGLFERD